MSTWSGGRSSRASWRYSSAYEAQHTAVYKRMYSAATPDSDSDSEMLAPLQSLHRHNFSGSRSSNERAATEASILWHQSCRLIRVSPVVVWSHPGGSPSASTGGSAVGARSAEVAASANTGDVTVSARSAEVPASASTDGNALGARSVEVPASASTGECAVSARIAEVAASASTGGSAVGARSVEVAASASTGGGAVSARSAHKCTLVAL